MGQGPGIPFLRQGGRDDNVAAVRRVTATRWAHANSRSRSRKSGWSYAPFCQARPMNLAFLPDNTCNILARFLPRASSDLSEKR